MAIVVVAVVTCFLDSLREKRPVPLTTLSGGVCFKHSSGTQAEYRCHRALADFHPSGVGPEPVI